MPRKPNYKFDRMERERQKAAKKAEKAARKADKKEAESAGEKDGNGTSDTEE